VYIKHFHDNLQTVAYSYDVDNISSSLDPTSHAAPADDSKPADQLSTFITLSTYTLNNQHCIQLS